MQGVMDSRQYDGVDFAITERSSPVEGVSRAERTAHIRANGKRCQQVYEQGHGGRGGEQIAGTPQVAPTVTIARGSDMPERCPHPIPPERSRRAHLERTYRDVGHAGKGAGASQRQPGFEH